VQEASARAHISSAIPTLRGSRTRLIELAFGSSRIDCLYGTLTFVLYMFS
jgi:hypothetical protein